MPRREQFIRPDVFNRRPIAYGNYVRVDSLVGLPFETKDKYPDGVVIKKYNYEGELRLGKEKSRIEATLFDTEDPTSLSLHQKAEILQNRQKKAKAFFKGEMPEFVLESQFFIAEDQDHEPHVFELQPEVKGKLMFDFLSADISLLNEEQRNTLVTELRHLLSAVQRLISQYKDDNVKYLPDISISNIMIDHSGSIKLIDTNYDVPFKLLESGRWKYSYDVYEYMIDLYEEVIESIEKLLSFIDTQKTESSS